MSDEDSKVISFQHKSSVSFDYNAAQKQLQKQSELMMELGDTSIITLLVFNGHTNIHVKYGTHVNDKDKELVEFFRIKMLEAIREQDLHKVKNIVDI